jgi:hypothetical protein
MKAGNKGLWSARQAVDVLNASHGRCIAKVEREDRPKLYKDNHKNRKAGGYYTPTGWVADEVMGRVGQPRVYSLGDDEHKGPFKALLAHFGKEPEKVGYLYLEVPQHRSTYCIRMRRLHALEDEPEGDIQTQARGKHRRLNDDPDHEEGRFARYEFTDHGESGPGGEGTVLAHTFGRGSGRRTVIHKPIPTRRTGKAEAEVKLKDDIEVEDIVAKKIHREEVVGKKGVEKAWAELHAKRQELAKVWEGKHPNAKVDAGGRMGLDAFGKPASTMEARLVLQKWLNEPGALRLRYQRKVDKGPRRTYFGRLLRVLSPEENEDYGFEKGAGVFVYQQSVLEHLLVAMTRDEICELMMAGPGAHGGTGSKGPPEAPCCARRHRGIKKKNRGPGPPAPARKNF